MIFTENYPYQLQSKGKVDKQHKAKNEFAIFRTHEEKQSLLST